MGGISLMEIKLKGRVASKGKAEGEAVVFHESIPMFAIYATMDQSTGVMNLPGHELDGKVIKDKVWVYPCGCGGVGYILYILKKLGAGPRAIINMKPWDHDIIDAVLGRVPMVYGFDANVLKLIKSGDHVTVDADAGTVTLSK
jgi:predicted aconitase with swiveling domain